jgi:hypothetical protein
MPSANQLNTTRNALLANLQTLQSSNPLAFDTAMLTLLALIADNISSGSGGGGGTATSVSVIDGANNLAISAGGSLSLPVGAATESTLSALSSKLPSALAGDRLKVDGSGVTQPVSIATLPTLAAGTNAIGSITNTSFGATQSGAWNIANITGTITLPTGAATEANQPTFSTAGTPSADVLTVQGSPSMTALKVDGSATTQPTKGLTESISQQFLTADDRVVTTNYSDTTKTTQTSVTITSATVTGLTGKTQLTITFSNPNTTSERVTYTVS